MKYRKIAAGLINQGKNVALYCSGLFATTNLLYLDKFYNVRPAVVIDNDLKKCGTAEFGIPIMTYEDAAKKFENLYYYIQGNTYMYSVTGDLLSKGVKSENIINYAPVEKRKGCLIEESTVGASANRFKICYWTQFNYDKNHCYFEIDSIDNFEKEFVKFRNSYDSFINKNNSSDCRVTCPMYKNDYHAVEPKIRLIGDYFSDRCELACIYCFVYNQFGFSKQNHKIGFADFMKTLLKTNLISDALVVHVCPTEKTVDEDVEAALKVCHDNIEAFESINLFSCCYAYRQNLEPLLAKGAAKSFWSLDAGTEETFEKIKQRKNIFGKVLENVEKYKKADAFNGASIVPKFSVFKGINDNEKDIDGFVNICKSINAKYCAIQWDYSDNEKKSDYDIELVRGLFKKVVDAGLKTTYTSGSNFLSEVLKSPAFYENPSEKRSVKYANRNSED
jgi:hypothetical protein